MSLRIKALDFRRDAKHLRAKVFVYQDDRLVHQDAIPLDSAQRRAAFVQAVLKEVPTADEHAINSQLLTFLEQAGDSPPDDHGDGLPADGSGDDSTGKKSQATRIVQLSHDIRFFHSPEGETYATFRVGEHLETRPLKARAFKDWLSRRYYLRYETTPNSQALADALGTLRGRALFDGPELPVFIRVAGHHNAIYLDLADDEWRVVEITSGGWRVVSEAPVIFKRTRGMRALPVPQRGGSLDDLRRFLNVGQGDWRLLLTWLLAVLRPAGPYVILLIHGMQGTAKSTLGRVLREITDPNVAPLRSRPKSEEDLIIAAENGWLVPLDNLSDLPVELSDGVCRLATGGGLGKRELYSDSDEVLFNVMRPVILNGISELATRGDLVDRGLTLYLPRISDDDRVPEKQFWSDFEKQRPKIIGALLDATVAALQNEPTVQLETLPRMADFALIGAASAPHLGWTAEEFLEAFDANRRASDELPLQSSPLTGPVRKLVAEHDPWQGTATELLGQLSRRADERVLKDRRWPRDATRLSGDLRRLAPHLFRLGISVDFLQRDADFRPIRIASTSKDGGNPQANADHSSTTASAASSVSTSGVPQGTPHNSDVDPLVSDHPSAAVGDSGNLTPWPAWPDTHGAGDAFGVGHSEFALITDAHQLDEALTDLLSAPVLGFDLETTGLNPRSHRIRLAQFALPNGHVYVVDLFRLDARVLIPLLRGARRLVGSNLKFDLGFLASAGLPIPSGDRLFDTQLAAQLLGAGTADGRLDRCGLATLAERYLGQTVDKSLQGSDWSTSLTTDQIQYAAMDARTSLRLGRVLDAELREADLTRIAGIEMRALPAVNWLGQVGMPIDSEAWASLSEGFRITRARVEQQMTDLVGDHGDKAINWRSPTQVLAVLRSRGHAVDSAGEAVLDRLVADDPLAMLLLEHRAANTRASRYGVKFLAHVDPVTLRIHADFHQLGADTGRMSCSKPNLQQIPRQADFRASICPPKGLVMIKCDYSQVELRLVAEISGDSHMIEAYQRGEDLHAVTAASVIGAARDSISGDARNSAKAVNFGLIYGMGAATLRSHAMRNFGVSLSEEQAMQLRSRFFGTYPAVRAWQRSQPDGQIETRTLAGRRRLAVTRFTEKLASPVQGSGADAMKLALALLWETRERAAGAAPVLCVHDELVVVARAEEAEAARAWLHSAMHEGLQTFLKKVPALAEPVIVRDWSGAPWDG